MHVCGKARFSAVLGFVERTRWTQQGSILTEHTLAMGHRYGNARQQRCCALRMHFCDSHGTVALMGSFEGPNQHTSGQMGWVGWCVWGDQASPFIASPFASPFISLFTSFTFSFTFTFASSVAVASSVASSVMALQSAGSWKSNRRSSRAF